MRDRETAGENPNPLGLSADPLAERLLGQYMDQIDQDERLQKIRELARVTGKVVAYQTPDNKLIDGDGKTVEKTPNTIIVRIDG